MVLLFVLMSIALAALLAGPNLLESLRVRQLNRGTAQLELDRVEANREQLQGRLGELSEYVLRLDGLVAHNAHANEAYLSATAVYHRIRDELPGATTRTDLNRISEELDGALDQMQTANREAYILGQGDELTASGD